MTTSQVVSRVLKPAAFAAGLAPFAWLVWAAFTGNLSVNPLADITTHLGIWALRMLCITLAITPLRRLTGWHPLIRFRRMAGLFAFFYATMHFLTYVIADRFAGLEFPDGIVAWSTVVNLAFSVGADIRERPFITVGFAAWLVMLPLALTSTARWIRRLGGKNWQMLHRLVYVAAILGVLHYLWLVKLDLRPPQRYAILVGILLGLRLVWLRRGAHTLPPLRRASPAARE